MYTSIQYADQPLVNTFTQFLIRVRNTANSSSLNLSAVSMQYWFEGPDLGPLPPSVAFEPWTFFQGRCEWSTSGCNGVVLAISRGYTDDLSKEGARFLLNVSFTSAAGSLLPSGEAALPALFIPGSGASAATDVYDVLLTISTTEYSSSLSSSILLNATQDYSFLQTPELPQQQRINASTANANGTIVPRKALPNPRITAYMDGQLAWGVLPAPGATPDNSTPDNSTSGSSSTAASSASQQQQQQQDLLPAGVVCEPIRSGAQRSCELQAVYCCVPADPSSVPAVSPIVPADWPPKIITPPQPLSSNITTNGSVPPINPTQNSSSSNASAAAVPVAEQISFFPPLPSQNQLAASTNSTSNSPQTGGGGSVAWIAGIAVGLVAGAVVGGILLVGWHRRRRRQTLLLKHQPQPHQLSSDDASTRVYIGTRGGSPPGGGPPNSPSTLKHGPSHFDDGISVHSGSIPPSPAGSTLPLLSHPLSNNHHHNHLFKYPSGVSSTGTGTTTAVLDTFNSSDGGGVSTTMPAGAAAFLPHNHHHHRQPPHMNYNGNIAANAAAAAVAAALPPPAMALLERKARTAPSRVTGAAASSKTTTATTTTKKRSLSLSSSDDDDAAAGQSSTLADVEPWQLQRSASWAGVLQETHTQDTFSLILQYKRQKRTNPAHLTLPPLSPLPTPVLLPYSDAPADVDLDVDFSQELEGHLGRCLGTGGFGSVYEAEWRGQKVAVKMLPPLQGHMAIGQAAHEALLREIQLASKFNSDRLVKTLGACTRDKDRCCLIMELASEGSLFHRIYDRNKRRIGYLEILQLGHDIACGLAYLHPVVVHRDLKPQNVLLGADGRAKIADFGISRVKDPAKSYFSCTAENGTPMYMAPEAMNGTRVDEKVDVYALGVILNEAWTRRQPWKDAHFFQIVLKVAINGDRPAIDADCPEGLTKLIKKCWAQNPQQRPSAADIVRLTDILMQEVLKKWERFSGPI